MIPLIEPSTADPDDPHEAAVAATRNRSVMDAIAAIGSDVEFASLELLTLANDKRTLRA